MQALPLDPVELEYNEKRYSELYNKNRELIKSLEYAAILQQGILPKFRHFSRIFEDSFILYLPQQIVSGDFYWLSEQEDDLIYIAVGDCTGHGVPGAMLSMLASNLLSYAVLNKRLKKTNKILKELDKRFIESFSSAHHDSEFNNDWLDISLCCIDRKKRIIYYSGAKRKAILIQDKKIETLHGSHYPIGGWQIEKERTYEATSVSYKAGDTLYLSSDGFQDQIGERKNKKYKSSALNAFLLKNSEASMAEQRELLEGEFTEWKGNNDQTDDICILGLRL